LRPRLPFSGGSGSRLRGYRTRRTTCSVWVEQEVRRMAEAEAGAWIDIEAADADELEALVGRHDEHLKAVQRAFALKVIVRDGRLRVQANRSGSSRAGEVLGKLLATIHDGHSISAADVEYVIRAVKAGQPEDADALRSQIIWTTPRGRKVRPRTAGQTAYVQALQQDDLVFAVGPAGTGKTYLAMAVAVSALREKSVARLVLTRPIREAGERLGFLPGAIEDKVDPYLRPIYDALYDLVGVEKFRRYLERGVVELAPLAYMRGRTLNDSFVVLDEAQNTTVTQMKMFLTRLGYGSRMVVTGDTTQVDLPSGARSGLVHAQEVLRGLPGVSICALTGADIVRHRLVQRIVEAYAEGADGSEPA
jgi:phosphate starvation-inducible PhoH-like protein